VDPDPAETVSGVPAGCQLHRPDPSTLDRRIARLKRHCAPGSNLAEWRNAVARRDVERPLARRPFLTPLGSASPPRWAPDR